jgi:hypothetical protein
VPLSSCSALPYFIYYTICGTGSDTREKISEPGAWFLIGRNIHPAGSSLLFIVHSSYPSLPGYDIAGIGP